MRVGDQQGAADNGESKNEQQPVRCEPREEADYALKEMDQVWDDGGCYALLGPSGCGKTTLLNVISGLVHPSAGRVPMPIPRVIALSAITIGNVNATAANSSVPTSPR